MVGSSEKTDSSILAQFRTNGNLIDIGYCRGGFQCFLNGKSILNIRSVDSDLGSITHLLKDIIVSRVGKKRNCIEAYRARKNSENLNPLIKEIRAEKYRVKLKDVSYPEDTLRKEVSLGFGVSDLCESSLLAGRLGNFRSLIKDINSTLTVCRSDALALTECRLVNSMWGADNMKRVISEINRSISDNTGWDRIEFYSEKVSKSIEKIMHKIKDDPGNLSQRDRETIAGILIPGIIKHYFSIKTIISEVLISLSKLIYIDEKFKEETGYPASWFINSNMLEDLQSDYSKLLGFVISIPSIEAQVFNVLDTLKKSLEFKKRL